MQALREAFAWRARRAAEIAGRLGSRDALGRAQSAVPVGLSAVRAEPDRIARAFAVAFDTIRRGASGFTPEQDAAAAECVCLAVSDVAAAERADVAMSFVRLRWELLTSHVPGNPEDALDAATLLLHLSREQAEARIAAARELAMAVRAGAGSSRSRWPSSRWPARTACRRTCRPRSRSWTTRSRATSRARRSA
ncbi:MAG: hypothetical protein M5U28_21920 [Sandaracinaceae bacterium]|nr:hypothetical protein [Sandaracinaceae bacterium]